MSKVNINHLEEFDETARTEPIKRKTPKKEKSNERAKKRKPRTIANRGKHIS